ncbi:MAG TPA: VWA domain-containing protein, partial [Acidobacteriota bacterium]|nr:VWA domain-containing protein [Acidobacteriota bacterium]
MENLTSRLVEFCRFLRANGFQIGIQETIDTLESVRLVSITERETFQFALRALVCTSHAEFELFDQLFEQFWNAGTPRASVTAPPKTVASPVGTMTRSQSKEEAQSESEAQETTGASAQERLKKIDFANVSAADLPLLEEIAFRLWKRMSVRLVRRQRVLGSDGTLDLRRTIRHSIGSGGDPLDLYYKGRKQKKLRLVTLLDVSGSMNLYSAFLLRFLYALHKYFKRVDSFVFSTRLTHVSGALRYKNVHRMLDAVSENVEDWSGGTRIGDCLREFNFKYARKILTKNTLVILLSDGWDTGAPEALAEELATIKRRVKKLIWLNP